MKQLWSYVAGIWIIMGFNLIATILNSSSPAILVFQVVCVFGQFNILAFAIVDVLQDEKEDERTQTITFSDDSGFSETCRVRMEFEKENEE